MSLKEVGNGKTIQSGRRVLFLLKKGKRKRLAKMVFLIYIFMPLPFEFTSVLLSFAKKTN